MVSLRAAHRWSWRYGTGDTMAGGSARTRTTHGCPYVARCGQSPLRWQSGKPSMPEIGRVRLRGVCAIAWCYTSPGPAHRPSAAARRLWTSPCDASHTCCPSRHSRGIQLRDSHASAYLARLDNPSKIASVRTQVIAIAIPVATPSQYSIGMLSPPFVSRRRLETA